MKGDGRGTKREGHQPWRGRGLKFERVPTVKSPRGPKAVTAKKGETLKNDLYSKMGHQHYKWSDTLFSNAYTTTP